MGTKLDPSKYDCHFKAHPDEPLFTLLARDPLAHVLVHLWAELTRGRYNGDEKSQEAHKVARQMKDWHKANVVSNYPQTVLKRDQGAQGLGPQRIPGAGPQGVRGTSPSDDSLLPLAAGLVVGEMLGNRESTDEAAHLDLDPPFSGGGGESGGAGATASFDSPDSSSTSDGSSNLD